MCFVFEGYFLILIKLQFPSTCRQPQKRSPSQLQCSSWDYVFFIPDVINSGVIIDLFFTFQDFLKFERKQRRRGGLIGLIAAASMD